MIWTLGWTAGCLVGAWQGLRAPRQCWWSHPVSVRASAPLRCPLHGHSVMNCAAPGVRVRVMTARMVANEISAQLWSPEP